MEEANLIVITQDYDNIKMPITFVIGLFSSVGFRITRTLLLSQDFLPGELFALLDSNTIILTSFDHEASLQNIRTILDSFVGGSYDYLKFGYFTGNQNKKCFIINDEITNMKNCIDFSMLRSKVGGAPILNIKVYTESQNQVLEGIKSLLDPAQFDMSYFYDCGDMWLTFESKSRDPCLIDSFSQSLYRLLGDRIYNDEPLTLADSVREFLDIHNQYVVVQDNTTAKVIAEYLLDNAGLNRRIILEDDLPSDFGAVQAHLTAKNYCLAVSIYDNNAGQTLSYINEVNCKNEFFEYKNIQKSDKRHLIHYFLYNILHKIRKNTW